MTTTSIPAQTTATLPKGRWMGTDHAIPNHPGTTLATAIMSGSFERTSLLGGNDEGRTRFT